MSRTRGHEPINVAMERYGREYDYGQYTYTIHGDATKSVYRLDEYAESRAAAERAKELGYDVEVSEVTGYLKRGTRLNLFGGLFQEYPNDRIDVVEARHESDGQGLDNKTSVYTVITISRPDRKRNVHLTGREMPYREEKRRGWYRDHEDWNLEEEASHERTQSRDDLRKQAVAFNSGALEEDDYPEMFEVLEGEHFADVYDDTTDGFVDDGGPVVYSTSSEVPKSLDWFYDRYLDDGDRAEEGTPLAYAD